MQLLFAAVCDDEWGFLAANAVKRLLPGAAQFDADAFAQHEHSIGVAICVDLAHPVQLVH